MAETVRIECINKSDRYNPHERIINVGGTTPVRWKITQPEAIRRIKSGAYRYYVSVDGRSVWVIVAVSQYGNEYIKTEADGVQPDNLLRLPECP